MTESEAKKIASEIQEFCLKHNLWVSVEYEMKPNLKMIRIRIIATFYSKLQGFFVKKRIFINLHLRKSPPATKNKDA